MSITQEQLDYWAAEELADAEAELNALHDCSVDEMERNYRNWSSTYQCKIQESLTPEIRACWLACQEWLDEHTPY